MSDAMRRLIEERWPDVREEAQVQLDWLRTAVATNVESLPGGGTEARKVAHQLRGRFGMYGRREASEVAGAIEDRLVATDPSSEITSLEALGEELTVLIGRLEALLDREPALSPTE